MDNAGVLPPLAGESEPVLHPSSQQSDADARVTLPVNQRAIILKEITHEHQPPDLLVHPH